MSVTEADHIFQIWDWQRNDNDTTGGDGGGGGADGGGCGWVCGVSTVFLLACSVVV